MKQNGALSPQPDVNSCVISETAEVAGLLVLKGAFVLGFGIVDGVVDVEVFVSVVSVASPSLHSLQEDLQF